MESAENTEKYKEDFLYEGIYEKIDLAVVSRLQGCEYYQKWQKKSNKITKKYPFLKDLFQHGKGAISLTKEEHEAFVCYMELRDNIETAQKQECYYVGQVHANMLQRDLDKRINGADGNCVGKYTYSMNPCLFDEGIWEQEEAQEMLGDFINIIRSERTERLKKYPQYQKLKYRESKILKSHPFVKELIDNGKVSDKLELSHTQQQVLMNYIVLQQKKAVFEMLETLLIGCRTGIGCAKILQ